MFEAFVNITYGVISSVIYDLLKGNKKTIPEAEINQYIEKSVLANMDKFKFIFEEKEKYYDNLLKEIKLVIGRMEHLTLAKNGITLTSQPAKKINPDEIISSLVNTIELRKNELGLTESSSSNYKSPVQKQKPSDSQKKLESLIDRINKRRQN